MGNPENKTRIRSREREGGVRATPECAPSSPKGADSHVRSVSASPGRACPPPIRAVFSRGPHKAWARLERRELSPRRPRRRCRGRRRRARRRQRRWRRSTRARTRRARARTAARPPGLRRETGDVKIKQTLPKRRNTRHAAMARTLGADELEDGVGLVRAREDAHEVHGEQHGAPVRRDREARVPSAATGVFFLSRVSALKDRRV